MDNFLSLHEITGGAITEKQIESIESFSIDLYLYFVLNATGFLPFSPLE